MFRSNPTSRYQGTGYQPDINGFCTLDIMSCHPLHKAFHQRQGLVLTAHASHPDLFYDLPDLGLEAHVKHPISLVQHEVGAAPQVGRSSLQEVDEATRSRYDDLDAALQIAGLAALRRASEHARVAHVRRRAEVRRDLLDLLGQFSGRCQHQRDRPVVAQDAGLVVNVHNGWEDILQQQIRVPSSQDESDDT